MYTKKQKAIYRGLCYGLCAWLSAAMLGSVLVALYIQFFDNTLSAREIGTKYHLPLFFVVGAPAFLLGYKSYKE